MAMNSGPALASALATVRKRIQQIKDRKEILGEQNTKAALIDPILTALGWDLQEIDEVRREYRRKPQDNPVDYALFLNRSEVLFIEAKSLERDLNDRKWVSQNLSYATVVGVRWCALTNGDEYRIYNAHAPVDVDEKLFRSVRISDAEHSEQVAETLCLLSKDELKGRLLDELWKVQFLDSKVSRCFEAMLAHEDQQLVRLIAKRAKGVTPSEVRASLKRAKVRIEFPVPSLSTVTNRRSGQRVASGESASAVTILDLIRAGLIRPPLRIEAEYKKAHLTAEIRSDGRIEFGGQVFDSPSTAGVMARKSVIGTSSGRGSPQINGWTFWRYEDGDTGKLRVIDDLRREFAQRRNSKKVIQMG